MEPIVYLGSEINIGKALQLYVKDNAGSEEPCLILGLPRLEHPEILERVLEREGISFEKELLPDEQHLAPAPSGETYRLVGAGWFRTALNGDIVLDNRSESYRLCIDAEHAGEVNGLVEMCVRKEAEPEPVREPTETRARPHTGLDDRIPF